MFEKNLVTLYISVNTECYSTFDRYLCLKAKCIDLNCMYVCASLVLIIKEQNIISQANYHRV